MLAAAGADDPAAHPAPAARRRARQRPRRTATPRSPARSCAATSNTVRAHLADLAANAPADAARRTSRWPAPPSTASSPTAGCCRSAPPRCAASLDAADAPDAAARGSPPAMSVPHPSSRHTREELAAAARRRPPGRRPPRRARADHGRPARGPRQPDPRRPRAGRATGRWSSRSSSTRCSSAPGEDLDRYPRTLEADLEICAARGRRRRLRPVGRRGLPRRRAAGDRRSRPAGRRCSRARTRPGHFRGVLTVVAKLFGLVRPDVAVFGEKDYQQLALIRRMVLRPLPGRRGRRRRDRARARRPRAVEPQPLPRRRGQRRRPLAPERGAARGAGGRGVRRGRRARLRPAPSCAADRASTSTTSRSPVADLGRAARRSRTGHRGPDPGRRPGRRHPADRQPAR